MSISLVRAGCTCRRGGNFPILCVAYLTHDYAMCNIDAGHMASKYAHNRKHHNAQDGTGRDHTSHFGARVLFLLSQNAYPATPLFRLKCCVEMNPRFPNSWVLQMRMHAASGRSHRCKRLHRAQRKTNLSVENDGKALSEMQKGPCCRYLRIAGQFSYSAASSSAQ